LSVWLPSYTNKTAVVIQNSRPYAESTIKVSACNFDGCPAPPVPADFAAGGAGLDLAALGANSAVTMHRHAGPDTSVGLSDKLNAVELADPELERRLVSTLEPMK
jgi:hypothetical protein